MKIARICTISFVCLLCLTLCLATAAAFVPAETAFAYDSYYQQTPGFDDEVFTALDYGLYWYGTDSRIPKKAGTEGANFDPNKPTLIFTHGMKITEGYNRRDLVSLWAATNGLFADKGYDPYMYYDEYYQILLEMGYNVGHFYWNQLAEISIDEDYRIWTSDLYDEDGNDLGLNYFVSNNKGKRTLGDPAKNPHDSVAVVFGEAIKSGLGASYNQPWRLVGHSMGGQLVLATTQNLIYQKNAGTIGQNLVPERVSLVDPYMCNTATVAGMRLDHMGGKEIPAGTWTAELCADALADIAAENIAVDAYGGMSMVYRNYEMMTEASIASTEYAIAQRGEGASDLADLRAQLTKLEGDRARYAALTERIGGLACWTHLTALADKYGPQSHCMIIDYYFTTMYEDEQSDNYGNVLPSLDSTTEYIRGLRGYNFRQVKREGSTANPFYRHTTDFVKVDARNNPITNILTGVAEGYQKATVLDVNDEVVQEAAIDQNGRYTLYSLDNGVYTVRYEGEGKTTVNEQLVVDNAANGNRVTIAKVEAPQKGNDALTLVYILIVPVVLLIVMVVVIVVAAKTVKKAKNA